MTEITLTTHKTHIVSLLDVCMYICMYIRMYILLFCQHMSGITLTTHKTHIVSLLEYPDSKCNFEMTRVTYLLM